MDGIIAVLIKLQLEIPTSSPPPRYRSGSARVSSLVNCAAARSLVARASRADYLLNVVSGLNYFNVRNRRREFLVSSARNTQHTEESDAQQNNRGRRSH